MPFDIDAVRRAYFAPPKDGPPDHVPTREELIARYEQRAVAARLAAGRDPAAKGIEEHGSLIGGPGKPLRVFGRDPEDASPIEPMPLEWFAYPQAISPLDGNPPPGAKPPSFLECSPRPISPASRTVRPRPNSRRSSARPSSTTPKLYSSTRSSPPSTRASSSSSSPTSGSPSTKSPARYTSPEPDAPRSCAGSTSSPYRRPLEATEPSLRSTSRRPPRPVVPASQRQSWTLSRMARDLEVALAVAPLGPHEQLAVGALPARVCAWTRSTAARGPRPRAVRIRSGMSIR